MEALMLVAVCAIPVLSGYFLYLRRNWLVLGVIGLLYVATGVLGIPRVHTKLYGRLLRDHAAFIRQQEFIGNRGALSTPGFRSFSTPILPGVILCFYDFTIAPLYAEGWWSLYWVGAPEPWLITRSLRWIS
jgi:hypothetical protein